MKLESLTQN